MDVNTAPSIQHQLNNGDPTNKKIKLTPFIVVPPTSSFVKLEDSLLKGIGNHLTTSNTINTTGVNTSSANLITAAAVKLTNSNGNVSSQNLSMANLNSLPVFTTNPSQSNTSSVSTFSNGQIAIATNKPGDKAALTQTNYLMLNGLTAGGMLSGQFIESATNGQARGMNSICINKLSSVQNGTALTANLGPVSTTSSTNGQVSSSVALAGASSQSALDAINGSANNKVSVQYLSVSYNNSGNISITSPSSAASLAALNGNGTFTINSADLQQQILNTLKSSDLNLGLLKSFVPATTISNSTQQTSNGNSKQSKTGSSSVLSTNSSFANGPTNNCDQQSTNNQSLNLDDCQLPLHSTPSSQMSITNNSLTNSLTSNLTNSLTNCLLNSSTNSLQHSNGADTEEKHSRMESHSPLNEGALTDFDIKTLNSHNLLNATNRLLISPTDFLTLTEDHNNNVSSNQNNSSNYVRNSAVKRDVSLSSGCLSSNVELLRKSSSYLGSLNSLNNSFIGFERYCESPLFIDHHRDMHLLDDDDDDELKDVNKEFINSEDLFFGTSLSDGQNLDQSQLDQLVFILDHQQPEPPEQSNHTASTTGSTTDTPTGGNNCVVILDINQQQQSNNQNSSNSGKVTVKTEPNQSFNTSNSSSQTSNSVLLNCLTSNNNLLSKPSHQQLNDSFLQLTNSDSDLNSGSLLAGQSANSKLIDGIKYIIQNDASKLDTKHKDSLIKINSLPAYLTNTSLENGQLIVNMNSTDKGKLLSGDSLGTQAVLIQHAGGRANNTLNRQSLLTGQLNNSRVNGNSNGGHVKGSAIKSEVCETIVQTDLSSIKTEKPDHGMTTTLSAGDLDLTNLFGKNTTNISVNVSVANAEDSAVSSTTNGNGSKGAKIACSPDSSSGALLGAAGKLNATNSFLSFQNSTNSANSLVNNSMAILTNGDTNSTNNSSNSTTSHLTSCTPALVATPNSAGNGSTYTLLPTGLLQLAANIAAVFPSSNVQKQVALQLLREDGSSLIVPIVPNRNAANNGQNSNGNLSGNSGAINQDGANNSIQQTSSMPQATQLITISADSLNNLIQGGLNGNVIATITTGQTATNPTVISTSLGSGSASTTSSTTSVANDQDRPFKCDLCNATFTRLGNFTRHKKIHSLPSKVGVILQFSVFKF